jgi:hypothetical protein
MPMTGAQSGFERIAFCGVADLLSATVIDELTLPIGEYR